MSQLARGYLYITLASTLWGVSGVLAKYLFAERSVAPFLLVQVRMGLSALLLITGLAIFAPHLLRIRSADLSRIALWGIAGMAGVQFFYFVTISETNVATAIFLQYLSPIVVALYAWMVERQRPGLTLIACLVLAMAGAILLLFGGTAQLLVSPLGLTTGLLSAVTMSFYTVYGARGVGRMSPWTMLAYGLFMGFLFWLAVDGALALFGYPGLDLQALINPPLWGFFLFIALFATVVPFGLYLTGLRSVAPTLATITGMLEPVVAGLVSYVALGETLRGLQVVGGGLIIAAVLLLQARNRARTPAVSPQNFY